MGTDLVSACIFCAGWLLGMDLAPRDGLGGQMGFSYATMARRYDFTSERVDSSDVTPKFVLVGLGNARSAADGLGAGTPVSEWRFRVAFGASHDQQERKAVDDFDRIIATGTGRYENFALLGRLPVGDRDSVELAVNRRAESATDLVNVGGENGEVTSSRSLSASRADVAAGWRHRWQGLEAEAAFRWTKPTGYDSTSGYFQKASGNLFGADAEVRWRQGGWTVLLHGERMGGNLDVHGENAPNFENRDSFQPAVLSAVRLGAGYSWPKTELFLTTTYDRQKLPFVSLAVLGTETVAFTQGYDPTSVNKELFFDLAFRYAFTPSIRLRVGVVLGWGNEDLSLVDSAGVLPNLDLDIKRRGVFGGGLSGSLGAPETALFIGADFSIGAPSP
jgi:hypothetical protein